MFYCTTRGPYSILQPLQMMFLYTGLLITETSYGHSGNLWELPCLLHLFEPLSELVNIHHLLCRMVRCQMGKVWISVFFYDESSKHRMVTISPTGVSLLWELSELSRPAADRCKMGLMLRFLESCSMNLPETNILRLLILFLSTQRSRSPR